MYQLSSLRGEFEVNFRSDVFEVHLNHCSMLIFGIHFRNVPIQQVHFVVVYVFHMLKLI